MITMGAEPLKLALAYSKVYLSSELCLFLLGVSAKAHKVLKLVYSG